MPTAHYITTGDRFLPMKASPGIPGPIQCRLTFRFSELAKLSRRKGIQPATRYTAWSITVAFCSTEGQEGAS